MTRACVVAGRAHATEPHQVTAPRPWWAGRCAPPTTPGHTTPGLTTPGHTTPGQTTPDQTTAAVFRLAPPGAASPAAMPVLR
ncbi:hypothetical protein B9W64_22000 [Streptomyces sp. CS159]|nr:hypothetical protein B9W64_22000 [Streptomyces sp. CS159]